jgi:hypothetical protein
MTHLIEKSFRRFKTFGRIKDKVFLFADLIIIIIIIFFNILRRMFMKFLKISMLMLILLTFFEALDLFSAHFAITDGTAGRGSQFSASVGIVQSGTPKTNPKIGNSDLEAGDEIGVFDSDGNCWGFGTWVNYTTTVTITVWGEEPENPPLPARVGMITGKLMLFRIWDASALKEYSIVTATVSSGNLNFLAGTLKRLASLQALLVPDAPVITNPSNGSVSITTAGNLTWNAATGAISYDYILADNAAYTTPVLSGNLTDLSNLSIPYTGLTNGIKYYFKVRGKNGVGDGSYTESQFFTKLGQVTLISPADNAKGGPISGTLSWNSVTNATSYDVYLSTDINFTGATAVNVSGTSNNYSGLSYFTNYYWKVQAKDGSNTGDASEKRTFLTVVGVPTLTLPADNAVGQPLSGSLTWEAVTGATSYDMLLSNVVDFTGATVVNVPTGTSYNYSGLTNFTSYYWKVRAKNADGVGIYSGSRTFRTIISVPSLTLPADNATAQPLSGSLTWGAVTSATSYDVQLATTQDVNAVANNVASGTSYNYSGLANYTSYYWRAKANSTDGSGNYSEWRTFKTVITKPVISSPANSLKGAATSGNVTWGAVDGADSYKLQIATEIGFTNIVFSAANISGISAPFSGLNYFTNYYVRVSAVYVGGETVSDIVTFKTNVGAPTNTSPASNASGIALNGNVQWTSVTGAENYDVEISNGSNTVVSSGNVAAPATSYAFTGLSNNTQYFWHVRAKNNTEVITGAWSNTTSFTTLIGSATLVSPANNAVNVNPLTGSVSWTAPSGATTYRVQISTDNTFAATLVDADGLTSTNYTYANLGSKTQYFWRVYSYSGTNTGSWTTPFNFTTGLGKVNLNAPANNFAGAELNNVTASWYSLNGAATYRFTLSENADLSSPIINQGSINVANYVINGLNYNRTYYWGVRGQDANGDGPLSDIRTFGTKIDKPTLTTPANNATDVALDGQMKWNAATGAESYRIQVSLVNTFASTVIDASSISGTTYNYSGLTNDKDHFWRVCGIKGGALGEWSTAFTFKTMKLQAPTLVSPTNNKTGVYFDVKLDWDPVVDATKYNVRLATDINFTNIVAEGSNLTPTEMNVTGLFYERTYYWQAQAVGPLGLSNWSAPFKFNTILYPVVNGNASPCGAQEEVYYSGDPYAVDDNWSVTGGTIVGSSTAKTVKVLWGSGSTGTVKLTRTSSEWGTFTDSKTLDITIKPQITVEVKISAGHYYQDMICINEEIVFTPTLDKTGTFAYNWTINNTNSGTGSTLKHSFNTVGQYVIKLSVVGEDCKSGSGSLTINITDECPVTVITNDFETCKNSSPKIKPTVFGGKGTYTYDWQPHADFVSYTVKDATVKNASFSKEFKLIATDPLTDKQGVDYVYMTLWESPSVSFNKTYLYVYNDDAVDLTNEDVLKVTISGGESPYQYKWTDNNGDQIDETSIHPPVGSSKYYLTITDANGCSSIEKRLIIFRSNGKEGFEEVVPGLSGIGFMFTYPNPVTNNVNIFADFNTEMPATLKIFNLMGKEVFFMSIDNTKIFENQINVSTLTAGAYTLVIQTTENTFVKQFIKQ